MVGCLSINSLSRCFALQILLEIVLVGLSLPRPPLRGGGGAISPDYFLLGEFVSLPTFHLFSFFFLRTHSFFVFPFFKLSPSSRPFVYL